MRESRTYGSGRGACHETHVPTATAPRFITLLGGAANVAARGAGAAAAMPVIGFQPNRQTVGARLRGPPRSERNGYVEGET